MRGAIREPNQRVKIKEISIIDIFLQKMNGKQKKCIFKIFDKIFTGKETLN